MAHTSSCFIPSPVYLFDNISFVYQVGYRWKLAEHYVGLWRSCEMWQKTGHHYRSRILRKRPFYSLFHLFHLLLFVACKFNFSINVFLHVLHRFIIRSATGENWQNIMLACDTRAKCDKSLATTGDSEYCGTVLAYAYFISFTFFCSWVVSPIFLGGTNSRLTAD